MTSRFTGGNVPVNDPSTQPILPTSTFASIHCTCSHVRTSKRSQDPAKTHYFINVIAARADYKTPTISTHKTHLLFQSDAHQNSKHSKRSSMPTSYNSHQHSIPRQNFNTDSSIYLTAANARPRAAHCNKQRQSAGNSSSRGVKSPTEPRLLRDNNVPPPAPTLKTARTSADSSMGVLKGRRFLRRKREKEKALAATVSVTRIPASFVADTKSAAASAIAGRSSQNAEKLRQERERERECAWGCACPRSVAD